MKVLDEGARGVAQGATIAVSELNLPVAGTDGLLIVFWKER
jgi:hypothetical protein